MPTRENPVTDPGLGSLIDEFVADRGAVERRYRLSRSAARHRRMTQLLEGWQARVATLSTESLAHAGQIDWALLKNHLAYSLRLVERSVDEAPRLEAVLPFGAQIIALAEAQTAIEPIDPSATGATLQELAKSIAQTAPIVDDAPAAAWLKELQEAMERWQAFYVGYDPELDWWIREPLAKVLTALKGLVDATEEAAKNSTSIPGRAIGREALAEDIAFELLPYSSEELIAVGDREYAWCMEEMLKASAELGFGDDWRAAIESVKETYLPPGQQPAMVKGLALEATEYVKDMVTVPELAKEVWGMEMMAAERQKVNPFFLGGENIIVSYPTDTMTHSEKRMSMRGNNPNFSRATVQHELIPGHHLQMYMTERYRKYRQLFSTPFWIEGWTLYWELLLWELGFPRTPEERIGMLFWRMHRCVRISFSLRFHLGELTTAECVDILVDRVGHERANAEGEVRRSFNGLYPPLYQAAYMIGGLQFRAISRELREAGWSFREVHDAMLRENEMPPALMRLALLGKSPLAENPLEWRSLG